MPAAKVVRAACLTLALALLGSACIRPGQDADGNGVRGGTLRVLSARAAMGLDTAGFLEYARTYARTLYG
jgi:hypothetical protein